MIAIEALLVESGMDELIASRWAKFLNVVVDALREAESLVCSAAYWSEYLKKDGAFRKPNKKIAVPTEEGLTQALHDCLWKIKVQTPADHPLRQLGIEFHSETKMPSTRVAGKKSQRTDIWARCNKSENEPDIVFESKTVISTADVRKRYLGPKGLGCFLGPKEPYSIGPVGGLLAYTVAGTSPSWIKNIITEMEGPPPIALDQHEAIVGVAHEIALCSRVARPLLGITSPIIMFHMVMRFETLAMP